MSIKRLSFLHHQTAALAAVVFVALTTYSFPAAALFEDNDARNAILDLRSQVTAGQQALIDLQNQLEQAVQENARLRGRTELLEKQVEELTAQQKSFYQDLNSRVKKFEPQVLEIEGVQGTVQAGEKDAYEAALKAFQDSNMKKAEVSFQSFVKKYPDSPYWPLAQFWLGNVDYAQKDYKAAIAGLQAMVKRYPLHVRTPDALLTIGNSQVESGQKPAAKKTFEALIAKHPDSEAAGLAKQALKRLK